MAVFVENKGRGEVDERNRGDGRTNLSIGAGGRRQCQKKKVVADGRHSTLIP